MSLVHKLNRGFQKMNKVPLIVKFRFIASFIKHEIKHLVITFIIIVQDIKLN